MDHVHEPDSQLWSNAASSSLHSDSLLIEFIHSDSKLLDHDIVCSPCFGALMKHKGGKQTDPVSLMRQYFLIVSAGSDSSIWPCGKLKFPCRQFLIYSGSMWKQGNLVYDAAAANVESVLSRAKSTLRGKHPESAQIQTCDTSQ